MDKINQTLESHLTPDEAELLAGLNSPVKIQAFLDTCPYRPEYSDLSPLSVLRQRKAHCLDGGFFAAAALRRLGYPPLVVDLLPDPGMDDDHILAIFKRSGLYGAVAKSNFSGLRFRDPIYRSLRELVMSYFEDFYNLDGVKTLRYYSRPANLARFDPAGWEWKDDCLVEIEDYLNTLPRYPVLTPKMESELASVDP
jgi:hypothetical protein